MNERLRLEFLKIQYDYIYNNDVCFDEFKNTVMFDGFSMGDIVELYGALVHLIDGDTVYRENKEDEESYECID